MAGAGAATGDPGMLGSEPIEITGDSAGGRTSEPLLPLLPADWVSVGAGSSASSACLVCLRGVYCTTKRERGHADK